jgi:hypothetical protein
MGCVWVLVVLILAPFLINLGSVVPSCFPPRISQSIFLFFFLGVYISFFACAIAPLLSQYKAIGSTMLGITFSFNDELLNLNNLFYLLKCKGILVEYTLVFYLELFQLTTPLFTVKYNQIEFYIFNILLKTSIQYQKKHS